jgi:hypothetical protein
MLDRRAGRAPDGVGLDLVLFAEADEQRALVLVAQQDEAGGRAVEFLDRNSHRLRRALEEKADEIGRALRRGADFNL